MADKDWGEPRLTTPTPTATLFISNLDKLELSYERRPQSERLFMNRRLHRGQEATVTATFRDDGYALEVFPKKTVPVACRREVMETVARINHVEVGEDRPYACVKFICGLNSDGVWGWGAFLDVKLIPNREQIVRWSLDCILSAVEWYYDILTAAERGIVPSDDLIARPFQRDDDDRHEILPHRRNSEEGDFFPTTPDDSGYDGFLKKSDVDDEDDMHCGYDGFLFKGVSENDGYDGFLKQEDEEPDDESDEEPDDEPDDKSDAGELDELFGLRDAFCDDGGTGAYYGGGNGGGNGDDGDDDDDDDDDDLGPNECSIEELKAIAEKFKELSKRLNVAKDGENGDDGEMSYDDFIRVLCYFQKMFANLAEEQTDGDGDEKVENILDSFSIICNLFHNVLMYKICDDFQKRLGDIADEVRAWQKRHDEDDEEEGGAGEEEEGKGEEDEDDVS